VQHVLGCLLARVVGKSPLEYLTEDEVARQRDVIVLLIGKRPNTIIELIEKFIQKIEAYAQN